MDESFKVPEEELDENYFGRRRFGTTFSVKELERRGLDCKFFTGRFCGDPFLCFFVLLWLSLICIALHCNAFTEKCFYWTKGEGKEILTPPFLLFFCRSSTCPKFTKGGKHSIAF